MGQAVQPGPGGNEVHYERRCPDETTLYQVVQEHLETFLAQVETETGASLPDFVKTSLMPFSNAASSPTAFCACVVRGPSLKESVIGNAVYGREPPYDPRIDSTVRVEARRLRSKLEDYYATGGEAGC